MSCFSRIVATLPVVALFGAGCIAWNVGSPETSVERVGSRIESKTLSERAVSAEPSVLQPDGRHVVVRIAGKTERELESLFIATEKAVTKQRRMAFGLFPGWAEIAYDRNSRFSSNLKMLNRGLFDERTPVCLLIPTAPLAYSFVFAGTLAGGIVYTPYATFIEPFSENHECFVPEAEPVPAMCAHMAVFGFHRHQRIVLEKASDRVESSSVRTESRSRSVPGPWRARLEVPSIRYDRTVSVTAGGNEASFDIPATETGGSAQGTVTILEPEAGAAAIRNEADREFVRIVSGVRRNVAVSIPRKPGAFPGPPSGTVVTNYFLVEHRTEPAEPRGRYRLYDETPYAQGRLAKRMEILDGTPVHELLPKVREVVEGDVRRAFLEANPGVDESLVRAFATERFNGDVVYFDAVAYAVLPDVEPDGGGYDSETRRGIVRLRVRGRTTPEKLRKAKEWARDNISAIVADKNIVLEAGQPPPPGAKYRSLGETFENGVLMVEFEALE